MHPGFETRVPSLPPGLLPCPECSVVLSTLATYSSSTDPGPTLVFLPLWVGPGGRAAHSESYVPVGDVGRHGTGEQGPSGSRSGKVVLSPRPWSPGTGWVSRVLATPVPVTGTPS